MSSARCVSTVDAEAATAGVVVLVLVQSVALLVVPVVTVTATNLPALAGTMAGGPCSWVVPLAQCLGAASAVPAMVLDPEASTLTVVTDLDTDTITMRTTLGLTTATVSAGGAASTTTGGLLLLPVSMAGWAGLAGTVAAAMAGAGTATRTKDLFVTGPDIRNRITLCSRAARDVSWSDRPHQWGTPHDLQD